MTKVTNPLRYCPERGLPPYSYVPGLSPHPMSDPRGHSFGHAEPAREALDKSSYGRNAAYLYAIDLFNHGFYWEAHEEWEGLWHVAGRRGRTADFLKGLIKLAAAGVKAREGKAEGVRRHAERAGELLRGVRESGGGRDAEIFGLSLEELVAAAERVAQAANTFAGEGKPNARRSLPVMLVLL